MNPFTKRLMFSFLHIETRLCALFKILFRYTECPKCEGRGDSIADVKVQFHDVASFLNYSEKTSQDCSMCSGLGMISKNKLQALLWRGEVEGYEYKGRKIYAVPKDKGSKKTTETTTKRSEQTKINPTSIKRPHCFGRYHEQRQRGDQCSLCQSKDDCIAPWKINRKKF